MGVLKFDDVDDRLRWTTLTSGLANVGDGAWTLAVLFKRVGTAGFDARSYLLSGAGAGTTVAGASLNGSGAVLVDVGAGPKAPSFLTSTASPYLIVLSKGAGTVAPTLSWKLGSAGAWTDETLDLTLADQAAATMLDIGVWAATGDPANAWIGVVGWWEGDMSLTDKKTLDDNWRTSDWWSVAHGQPKFLAEMNVAAASVVDLAGNASVTSHVGTTLDAAETLDSWNFNGTGSVAGGLPPFDPIPFMSNGRI